MAANGTLAAAVFAARALGAGVVAGELPDSEQRDYGTPSTISLIDASVVAEIDGPGRVLALAGTEATASTAGPLNRATAT